MRFVRMILMFCVATAIGAATQTFTVLDSHGQTQPSHAQTQLHANRFVQGGDGNCMARLRDS